MQRTRLEDRYELGEVLGRGGMGVVYRATDRLMGREVALKTIIDVENNVALDLFYKEASIQSRIVHPNIVEVYDVGEFVDNDGVTKPFYVMPLLPGVTLSKLISDGSSRLTIERAVEIIRSACRGLEAAHENGLIHRDLKPGNLFVMKDDTVKLIDFGIAHVLGAGTKTLVKGTLHYMAPELLRMKHPTAMSDVYSLAVVAYQAFCRRLPFEGLSEGALTDAILTRVPPPVSELNPAVPQAISQVLHKAMAKQPWHRFARAKEFGDVLSEAFSKGEVQLYDPVQVRERLQRAMKSYEEGDYEFASEVVRELDAEGVLDSELTLLHKRVEQADRSGRIQKLLAAATRFREAGEVPVALRKVQEALDLDPEDADALGLKADIERQRREQQITDWFRLAREHLANQAFARAHEAIDNVLKLKPNETQAIVFRNEIERVQQEVERERERKEQLYQVAMNAWNKGDVTHALTRLEDLIALEREHPDAEGGRGAAYQKLYQEVRSEHQSIESAHKEALKHLAEDRLEQAEDVCDRYLKRYPANALFQSLKFDIEERRRQKLSGAIAETDRRVEQEPDLKKKMGILEEAMERYPGETHFERAISLVREKYNLVEGIVRKARFYEEKSQWTEALTQWRMLTTIDPSRPALQYEIERLEKEQQRQSKSEAKARSINEIDSLLEAGDAERAISNCHSALAEFPDDPEIKELLKLAEKRREKIGQAEGLLDQARTAIDRGAIDEGLDLLREANRRDDKNKIIRAVFVHTLIERANSLADSDWQKAAVLVDEVSRQEPQHSALESLRKKLETHKKQGFVDQFVDRARALQAEGRLDDAQQVVAKALGLYPGEPALTQLLATLRRAVAETASEISIDPIPEDAASSPKVQPHSSPKVPLPSAPKIQVPIVPDAPSPMEPPSVVPPAQPLAPETKTRPKTKAQTKAQPRTPTKAEPKPELQPQDVQPVPPAPEPLPIAPQPEPQPVTPEPIPPPTPVRPKPGFTFPTGWKPAAIILGGVILGGLLLSFAATWMFRAKPEPPPPAVVVTPPVHVLVVPAEAAISVNGKQCGVGTCEMTLGPGTYQVSAQLAGYNVAGAALTIGDDPQQPTPPLQLTLEPRIPALYLSSNRPKGTIFLDDKQIGEFTDGQFELNELPAGEHEIRVRDGATDARLRLAVTAGQAPQILGVSAINAKIAAAGSVGESVRIYADKEGLPVTLDGSTIEGTAGPTGIALTTLKEGWHEAALGSADAVASLAFENGQQPALTASISSDLPTGTLYVVTGEDGATVILNGQPYTRRKTFRGRLRIDPKPGVLKVRVEKTGFQPSEEQTVKIEKGKTARVEFKLALAPKSAGLKITGAVPGSQVWMGTKQLGTAAADGTLELGGLQPGAGRIELRHEGYRSKQVSVNLKEGETQQVEGGMERLGSTLMVEVLPANANPKIMLRPQTGSPRDIQPGQQVVNPGNYTILITAEGYEPQQKTVEVKAGEPATVRLELRSKTATPKKQVPLDYLPTLVSQGWTQQGNLVVKKGGGFLYFPVKPASGTYRMTALRVNGDRLHWFFRFGEQQDHWFYQLGKNRFERYRVTGNKRNRETRVNQGVDRNETFELILEVQPQSVTTRVLREGRLLVEDRLEGSAFDTARWGFYMENGDQVALSTFVFEGR